jgi:cytochrome bd-type quinol oxidase subunit 2
MFLGHYGFAFALKRAEPKLSLGTLFIAVQLADLLWGCFLLLGWEEVRIVPGYTAVTPLQFVSYPISHSLVAVLAWSLAGAALYFSWPTRDTSRHWQAALIVGLAVLSHYPLDVLVHVSDLPLTADEHSTRLGLGLWNSVPWTLAVEALALGAGLAMYLASRSHRHPVRKERLAALVLLLLAAYGAAVFGPPPPNVTLLALGDIGLLLVAGILAGWADRRASSAELATAGLSHRR